MKFSLLTTCILPLLSPLALHAENLVKNGDFETGDGNAFYQTPPWYNRGTGFNQGTSARSDEGAVLTGSHSATVSDRYIIDEQKLGPVAHIQKTDYVIQDGDVFSLTYEWRPADKYWQKATDTVRFVLFATANDKMNGEVVWSSELTSDFFRGKPDSVNAVSQKTEPVNDAAPGRNLFVMFYGLDTVNGGKDETPHWARVDNIEVNVLDKDKAP